ncbi:ferredoxin [Clostridium thermosuccinogenes]|jgi:uncharacterized 2Fe-2S/4Fe-4S cluster protein (DUF4445 family)|uniref:Ferredoxin n=1 Tax=Clostridium thermosuccinogenes TaxID=84032 RepID=A0A2K2FRV9_9CLOT|nr:ASKHA domain-containing protein [Pseudoclostridium thermosuccinogenes]AUS97900.1 ferredoxin [Pseudoclostridium thermosuccinogenes]PNU00197.1 ferredoxin [Pseudoclostridium thermosuccinogenes]PNU01521.1 ferredoxin [Pseudoclostridium thermosuccinogenes]
MDYNVKVHDKSGTRSLKAGAGINLLDFLRMNSVDVDTPCSGKGTCGKCKVRVQGLMEEASEKEMKLLGKNALENGYRLACYNKITSDIEVYVDSDAGEAKIATGAKEREVEHCPIISKRFVKLKAPDIEDQASDIERVTACSGGFDMPEDIALIRTLPHVLRNSDFAVTCGYMDDKLIFVEPGDTTQKLYGIAVDIGTTTVAAYLLDLNTGKKRDVYSLLNPQRKYGADVLSRIDYTVSCPTGLDEMNELIISCVNEAASVFCSRGNLAREDIYAVVLVGNTTMMHFLMKIPANNIAAAPFIPGTTRMHKFRARDMGIEINPFGYAVMFPCVSAYIGADTVAAVLSSGMYENDGISLLIDIGTNGEIVLGGRDWLYSCSTAAGPAFEGANIRNGVGGVKGAIDKLDFAGGFSYTTIGDSKAIGICGSGIVDAIAGMLSVGVIDETGRIVDEDDEIYSQLHESIRERLVDIDGMKAFLIAKAEECASPIDIAITQKDVRELQNAKAAIAAGIKVLVKEAGIKMEDVDRVYLAGGFGSYINIASALKIGLLPAELEGRVESIGNAAGAGAIEGIVSSVMLAKADEIRSRIKYIELSAKPEFVDEYVECMMFE